MPSEVILTTSEKAATYRTDICGWVDRHGRYHGSDEAGARRSGATHVACKCGELIDASTYHILCEKCESARLIGHFEKKNTIEYYGEAIAVYIVLENGLWHNAETYLWNKEEVFDYIYEHGGFNKVKFVCVEQVGVPDLRLEEIYDYDFVYDEWNIDCLPQYVLDAFNALKDAMKRAGSQAYAYGNTAISFSEQTVKEYEEWRK